MREAFLHFIWRTGRFDLRQLRSTTGQDIQIHQFGAPNEDGGPDFLAAQVSIDGLQWAGQVEMHLNSSEWYDHGHERDPAYDNVILHVVLREDRPVFRADGSRIPCLELRGRIPPGILRSYWRLMHNENWIPCQHQLHYVGEDVREGWLGFLVRERLNAKGEYFLGTVHRGRRDWEACFFRALARSMGGRVNGEAMEMLTQALPLRILQKHQHSLLQLEALLFGQSGLLPSADGEQEEYTILLKREYALLRTKYGLTPLPAAAWRFLRMRPNGFPTVRIAQLAALLHRTGQLFSKALAATDQRELMNMFDVKLSNYWRSHYRFGVATETKDRRLGDDMVRSILINAVAPALEAYGRARKEGKYRNRAVSLLRALPAEDNSVIRRWRALGWTAGNAADSQALLSLKKEYCSRSRCLECPVGQEVLGQTYRKDGDGPILSLNERAVLYRIAGVG
ncbi:DUF2851 family protein [Lewinella sp. W8]|uniref:DUF2851 family protein n=1 Tax=Lewinella sp. W8 TaxID=2528208 RepID=UPI0010678ED1|nr:DUF2851 family protein [Lewinella sp. W8]MTB49650.1 DUF2851 family protein [Lewinella sp. W8]